MFLLKRILRKKKQLSCISYALLPLSIFIFFLSLSLFFFNCLLVKFNGNKLPVQRNTKQNFFQASFVTPLASSSASQPVLPFRSLASLRCLFLFSIVLVHTRLRSPAATHTRTHICFRSSRQTKEQKWVAAVLRVVAVVVVASAAARRLSPRRGSPPSRTSTCSVRCTVEVVAVVSWETWPPLPVAA